MPAEVGSQAARLLRAAHRTRQPGRAVVPAEARGTRAEALSRGRGRASRAARARAGGGPHAFARSTRMADSPRAEVGHQSSATGCSAQPPWWRSGRWSSPASAPRCSGNDARSRVIAVARAGISTRSLRDLLNWRSCWVSCATWSTGGSYGCGSSASYSLSERVTRRITAAATTMARPPSSGGNHSRAVRLNTPT